MDVMRAVSMVIVLTLHTQVQCEVVASPLFGSAKLGVPFDDGTSTVIPSIVGLHSLNISYGTFVFGLQASYLLNDGSNFSGVVHGTMNQDSTTINLQKKERIVRIAGKVEQTYGFISQLQLYTQSLKGFVKVYGPFGEGKSSNTPFSIVGAVVGLFGRSGQYLNALGAYTNPLIPPRYNRTQMIGGIYGAPFDDYPALSSGCAIMLNMTINSGGYIFGFRTTYRFPNGTLFVGWHGPTGPNDKIIRFGDSEMIVQADVAVFSLNVNYLMFSTLDSRGTRRVYGPYGDTPQSNITTIHGTVGGFFGRVGMDHGTAITGLGFYV